MIIAAAVIAGSFDRMADSVAVVQDRPYADTVKFIGKAQLRRYRSATLNDEMTGAVIVYNNTTDVFSIDGAVTKNSPGAPAGRVRAMLTPTPDAGANKPASSSLPVPVLRATPALGGVKQ